MAIQMALLGRRERERESRRSSSSKKKVRLLCLKNETKMDKARKKKKVLCVKFYRNAFGNIENRTGECS